MKELSPSESERKAEKILIEALESFPEEMDLSEIGGRYMDMAQRMKLEGVRADDFLCAIELFRMASGVDEETWEWLMEQAVNFLMIQMGGNPENN